MLQEQIFFLSSAYLTSNWYVYNLWSSEKQESIKSAAELNITAKVNLYYILAITLYTSSGGLQATKKLVPPEFAHKN